MPVVHLHIVNGCQSLWVDAICINHNDDKAQQVANMHEIYKNAADVYIWLGPAKDDSDLLRVGRVSVSIRRLVQVQLGRPQLNEAASGSKAGPAESYRIGKAFC
jgi:Heterokaryon incompatibility protein (HET)